jgi:aryl-alcohol dehydrogenase-like predicted oxidoreductase
MQLDSLGKLVRSGKVRFIALSNEYPWGVMEFLRIARKKNLPIISCVQNGYSLLNRVAEFGLTEILYRERLGFMAYSPLAFGHLTGKYILDQSTKGRVTLFKGYAQRYNKPGVIHAVKNYMKLSEEFNITPTEMALSFVYHQWFVTSTVVGATSVNQLKQNLKAFKIKLPSELIEKIEIIHLNCMNPAP